MNSTALNTTSTRSTPSALVGWTADPSGRGTFGLISSCLTTIFLCTWVVIHPRIYQNEVYATLHKLALFLKAIIAPEFIAVEGLQEWAQCRRMEADCARMTKGELKPIHGFYISMLALRYRTPKGDRVIWPNQYAWLLEQRLIDWEEHASWGLAEEDIRDKSKTDSLAKLAALVQVSWFVAQCAARGVYGLPLSQLEAMTLGYIPLFIVTYFFWWDKPKDIRSPSIVELPDMTAGQRHTFEQLAVSDKFDNEGSKAQMTYWNTWYLTPRVFEKEEEDRQAQAARKMALGGAARETDHAGWRGQANSEEHLLPVEDPWLVGRKEVVVSHWDPQLYRSKIWPLACLFGISFGALHLACWKTVFPTAVEDWLWRASALMSMLSMLVFMHFEKVIFRWGGPLTLISLASPVLYMISRILMMGEAFAALRAESPAIYETHSLSNRGVHPL
ncbi:hypothetical protein BO70DRAFT_193371 [Aspergillus heteromorphus CBS 117.55]|uniref:Uncharacterized protein n=1 Tax=Aspergillus heteromorphus CBS 117.55 TaxID=1448321 RepID=A0A317WQ15_9EURO|nr:uncharacterized protein BO70DRAFT_193371 [Aspergillus heteromorphus CBS 117.55]PWY87372.1 hypothetical protein BO70DRAFT_193371 [Aspergillus heteromorphus CBS 117.55]